MTLPKTDLMRGTLTVLLLLSFQIALFALFHFQVPEGNRDMVVYMVGQLSGMVTGPLAFYFATTKSSQEKNAVIASATERLGSRAAPTTLDLTGAELPTTEGETQ